MPKSSLRGPLAKAGSSGPRQSSANRTGIIAGARALGVSRIALSELVNGRRAISPEMAIRLAKAFGSTAETWAGMQLAYDMAKDMAQAMQHPDRIKVRRVSAPAIAAA